MTPKQQRFVQEYQIDCNATAAAKRAGYSAKAVKEQGYENLTKPHIKNAIATAQAELSARVCITQEEVLQGLLAEARTFGAGSSHSARVTARAHLAKILGMFVERRVVEGNVGIVFDMRFGDGLRSINGDQVQQVIEHDQPTTPASADFD